MSRGKTRVSWIALYFEYEKFAEYTRRLLLATGIALYMLTASTMFLCSRGVTTLSIGMSTLYTVALVCTNLLGYLISMGIQREGIDMRRPKTPRERGIRQSKLVAVIFMLAVIVLSYVSICTIS